MLAFKNEQKYVVQVAGARMKRAPFLTVVATRDTKTSCSRNFELHIRLYFAESPGLLIGCLMSFLNICTNYFDQTSDITVYIVYLVPTFTVHCSLLLAGAEC